MIRRVLNNLKRAPIRTAVLLLFAAIVSLTVCSLQASGDAKMRDYEEADATLPITVTVTDPWGGFKVWSNYLNGDTIERRWSESHFYVREWIYKLFTNEEPVRFYDVSSIDDPTKNRDEVDKIKNETVPVELSLAEYLKDVEVKLKLKMSEVNGKGFPGNDYDWPYLIGISSLSCEPELLEDYGCELTWYDGYDESIFDGEEPLCLIPAGRADQYDNGNGEARVKISIRNPIGSYVNGEWVLDHVEWIEYEYTLKIAGTYTGGDWRSIYCPVPTVEFVGREIDVSPSVDVLSATLADNSRLDEFREKTSFCLPEASPDAVVTDWKHYADNMYSSIYDYALKIESENPYDLAEIEVGIENNRRITLIVLAASAVAGFVVSLIALRRRKYEILLMRTAGETKLRVYFELVLEQMICVLLGIFAVGAFYLWRPIDKLLLFALIYLVVLTLAIAIFMSKNIIKTVKEAK